MIPFIIPHLSSQTVVNHGPRNTLRRDPLWDDQEKMEDMLEGVMVVEMIAHIRIFTNIYWVTFIGYKMCAIVFLW